MSPEFAILAAFVAMVAVASFLLGYDAAERVEREAKAILDANLKLAIRQKHELADWVRENWPTEAAAYHKGVHEGYQQGVTQAPELEADCE